jgi:hypothetical protein
MDSIYSLLHSLLYYYTSIRFRWFPFDFLTFSQWNHEISQGRLQLFIHSIAVNLLPRFILLGAGDRNHGGIQARTASPIDKMAELEKSIHKALTKLTPQLESIEKKVDRNSADLKTI